MGDKRNHAEWVAVLSGNLENGAGTEKVYYWDRRSKQTAWKLPEGEVITWKQFPYAGEGPYKCYYHNVTTNKTEWELPPLDGCDASLDPVNTAARAESNSILGSQPSNGGVNLDRPSSGYPAKASDNDKSPASAINNTGASNDRWSNPNLFVLPNASNRGDDAHRSLQSTEGGKDQGTAHQSCVSRNALSSADPQCLNTWESRMQFIMDSSPEFHGFGIGVSLQSIRFEWEKVWTSEEFENLRPCKKLKDSIEKYVPGVKIVNHHCFLCEATPSNDGIYTNAQRIQEIWAKAKHIEDLGRPARIEIREQFEELPWRRWSVKFKSIKACEADWNPQEVFRCTLDWDLAGPAAINNAKQDAGESLLGTWEYPTSAELYFEVRRMDNRVIFVEEDGDAICSGELIPASSGRGWWQAEVRKSQGPNIILGEKHGDPCAILRLRSVSPTEMETSLTQLFGGAVNKMNVKRVCEGRCSGYGPGALMAMVSAMTFAMDHSSVQAAAEVHAKCAAAEASASVASPSAKSPAKSPKKGSFKDERLEEIEAILNDLKQLILEAHLSIRPKSPGAPQSMVDHTVVGRSHLDRLLQALEKHLVDKARMSLDDAGLAEKRVLTLSWQYALAVTTEDQVDALASISDIIERACECSSVGLPLDIFLDMHEMTCRFAAKLALFNNTTGSGIKSEEIIQLISHQKVAIQHHYAAHWAELVLCERAASLQQLFAEAYKELRQNYSKSSRWNVEWDTKSWHRPDFQLTWDPRTPLPPRSWGLIQKGNVVLVLGTLPVTNQQLWSEANVFLAEVKHDFNADPKFQEGADTGLVSRSRPPEKLPPLSLKMWSGVMPEPQLLQLFASDSFVVQPLGDNRVTHDRQLDALYEMDAMNPKFINPLVRDIIRRSWEDDGGKYARNLAAARPKGWTKELDQLHAELCVPCTTAQGQAVQNAIRRRCSLVRGPPGTGKTHTACAIIDLWLKMNDLGTKTRVLVVTQSNAAALNVQQRLARYRLPSIRVGPGLKPEELMEQQHFKSLFTQDELQPLQLALEGTDVPDLYKTIRGLQQRAADEADIVVMTCIASGNENFLQNRAFERVLLDEAAQATEPTSVVPLLCGAESFVAIGDDKQLPATVLSLVAAQQGLSRSLFERLLVHNTISVDNGFTQLDVQRRMHSTISAFPSVHFYDGGVANGIEDISLPAIPGCAWERSRVIFVDCQGPHISEETVGTSTQNQAEAKLLVETLVHLMQDSLTPRLNPSDVAVITGYSAQRQLLKQHLAINARHYPRSGLNDVRVDTVDGFQGMERALVLVSTVRSNLSGDTGFLRDHRRANVLLTRAQRGLIVFGDGSTLSRERTVWGPWLRWMNEYGHRVPHEEFPRLLTTARS